jgi:methylenetetrahydrofolate dehydrogenase (NADP+) / methenyltetrahydrofolate cyclohydrolase
VATIIDGRLISKEIQEEVRQDVERLVASKGVTPGLAVVLVGDNPASKLYVGMKAKTCVKLGMKSVEETLPASATEAELLALVDRLNKDNSIHGILVQLPLPSHIDSQKIINALDPRKDVDGLHPFNAGLLCAGHPRFIPCTPYGVCELLVRYKVALSGSEVVVLGRSNLVGRPLSVLLSSKGRYGDATVTVCHSRSRDLPQICRRADVLVVAIGQREFVSVDMVKPGAVVIDVGTHPPRDETEKLRGDVQYEAVSAVASMITPVPGGVGPMTIAMLMRNSADAAIMLAR